jgi:CBS domain-containing protein
MTLVREAMVPEPPALEGTASAQEAGELLSRDEVRAVFVIDGGRLIGVVTRKTLVREIVAAGLDPRETELASIAEEPWLPVDGATDLVEAFHLLEEHDLERVPVLEDGRLVGVLSRAIVQRRLAEDESPDEAPDEDA